MMVQDTVSRYLILKFVQFSTDRLTITSTTLRISYSYVKVTEVHYLMHLVISVCVSMQVDLSCIYTLKHETFLTHLQAADGLSSG
jgi:hypothetical protein